MLKKTYLGSKSNIKGKLFEACLKELLYKAGFSPNVFTEQLTLNSEKLHGRGATYNPDIFGQFELGIPFVNPLLIIGEAKYYPHPVKLAKVREFLGSFIDLSQYSRVNTKKGGDARYSVLFSPKFTYCPIMFSAKGFQKSAEGLMFVHGINYISYENSRIVDKIFILLEDLLLSLKLTKFQSGDYSKLKRLQIVEELRPELKKQTFKKSYRKLVDYLTSINSVIGVLDRKYPVHILYNKPISADPHKEVKIVIDKKNNFSLKSMSGRIYGEFSLSMSFLKEYYKYYKKLERDDLVFRQIDLIIKRKHRWEIIQVMIDEISRKELIESLGLEDI